MSIIDFYFFKKRIYLFFSHHIMIESSSPEEVNIIQDVRNLFRYEKIDTTVKYTRNFCRFKKQNEEINDRILREIRNLFILQKENKAIINNYL